MEQRFTHLEWDSSFFGFKVARINLLLSDEADLTRTLRLLHDNKYRLVYWYVPAGQHENSRIALAHGGFLADEKVTYVKELADILSSPRAIKYFSIPYLDATPDTSIINLALQSGEYSRFRLDPMFPRELCDKLYTCWITRSVNKEIAWEVLMVKECNELIGLITLATKDNRGDIGLVAVAEQARGKGIGRVLVTDADSYFIERGFTHAQVVTQKRNLKACGLYESCGYHIENVENIFHFWL